MFQGAGEDVFLSKSFAHQEIGLAWDLTSLRLQRTAAWFNIMTRVFWLKNVVGTAILPP
jgi:hypothetical protein